MIGAASSASAQSNDVVNRLKRLENEVNTLNRAVYKGETPPASAAAPDDSAGVYLDRINRLENDVRTLTGKVEQQAYDVQQMQQQVQALSEDARMRLDAIEGQLRAAPAQAQQPAATQPQGQSVQVDPSAQPVPAGANVVTGSETGSLDAAALYEQGFAEIKREDYPAAEKTFSGFIKQYADHPLAPNAYYWLGETYYVRKNYDKASRVFAEAYKKYPGGPKGADNLLKLGLSLAGKGEKQNACIALGQLKKEYPNGPAPILKRGDDELASLGCS